MARAETSPLPGSRQYPTGKVWLAGAVTLVAALLANYLLRWLATGPLGIESDFNAMATVPPVAIFTFVGVLLATLVWWWISRRSRAPERTWNIVALVALVVSLVPDVLLMLLPPVPGTGTPTWPVVILLMVMHVVTYALAVLLLPRLSRA